MKQLLNTLLGSCALLALAGEPRASAQTGFWVGEPPMPTARGGLGTAVLNGQIYAIGGDNGSHLNTAESFDPISETWQSLAGMSTPRWVPGVAGVNGLIYAMGGYPRGGDDRVNSSMEAYNPANNTWSPVANMLTPRGNLGAVTVDGLIYAIGGNTSHTAFSEVEAYNPTTDSWTSKAHLPTARSGLGVAVAYGLIYAIGGSSPTYLSGCAVNEVYDPVADQWTTKASAPEILPDARVAAVNGILYVTGNTASPGRVYAYHPITDTWSTNASLLTPAIEQGWVTANGAVYSVGGIGNSQVLPTTEAFHPAYTPATATVVLANDPLLAHPLYLTGDGTNLFASGVGADSNQYIFRVPEDGGAATVWCPAFNPNGIAIVGSNIFWIDPNAGPGTDTEILRASVATGGSPNAIYVGLNAGQPIVDGDGLASDGQFLYAVDEVAGNVWRLQPDGGGLTQLGGARYAGGFGYEHVNNIAVSRGVVYVSDTGARAISPQVVSIATNGDSFSTLALGAPLVSPTGIAVGNGIAYVADPGANNTIWQIPIGGGTPVALVSGAPFSWLWSLAFVNGTLYVADRGNGTIYAIVVAPGGSKPLTPGSSGIQLAQGAGISISSTQLIAAALLEVGELRHFHAVAPDFPAQPPGAERRALPVVLDETDVVQRGVDADRRQRAQVQFLEVGRRRLHDHLELVVVLHPVRVLAVAPILRAARGLHIGCVPGLRAQRAQGRGGMERARAHFHVVGLQDEAALAGPIVLQGQDQFLKTLRLGGSGHRNPLSFLHLGRFVRRGKIGATPPPVKPLAAYGWGQSGRPHLAAPTAT